jgi:hypothetical protein
MLASVTRGEAPEVDFRPLAPVRWERIVPEELTGVSTLKGLEEAVATQLAGLRSDAELLPGQEWMLRVVLSGPCPLAPQLADAEEVADLADRLTDTLGVLHLEVRVDRLTRPLDLAPHRDQPHLLGETLTVLDELESNDELLDRIAPPQLAGLDDDDPETRRSYLRQLLEGLDLEAAQTLLRESAE